MDLAKWVNEITGNDAGTKFVHQRDWDKITRRLTSIEKAEKILGYEPKTKMRDGIQKTHDWIVAHIEEIEKKVQF